MEIAVTHFIIFGVILGLTEGAGVLPDGPLIKAEGESVMFTTTLTESDGPFGFINWGFGDKSIITFPGESDLSPEYVGRVTLNTSTGSLELRNLKENDTGEYRVTIAPSQGNPLTGTTTLRVYAKVSGATFTTSAENPVEGNSFNLTCEASGSALNRTWTKDGAALIPDDVMSLYDSDTVLSFKSLKRTTQNGNYSCIISNPVSSSEVTYNMVVKYGPENVKITGPHNISSGETLTLICDAASEPPANYTWTLNGTEIHNSFKFTKDKVKISDSGIYVCQAKNDITGKRPSAEHKVNVTGIPALSGETPACSAGCIAGVVIACLVVCGAAAGGGYYIYNKKLDSKAPPQTGKKEEHVYEDASVVYENI